MFTPAGEDILPTYYADPGTNHPDMPTNPCNPSGEEDYAGTTIGLDNDGDLLYDGDDPDCAAPECTIDADCDDGLFCNGMETCETGTGTCQAGTPPCDPLTEICNEETGTCDVAQVGCTDDGDCDDGLFCNGMETCETGTGTCQAGTPPDCDDGVGCTDDSCDEVNSACVNAPNDANCPDDGLFCTGDEFCDPAADCSSTGDPCPAGSVCNEDTDTCDVVTGKVTICHIPPGNPAKARTLSISAISVADHLAHGDLLGPCAE
jgi:hypothetical protein